MFEEVEGEAHSGVLIVSDVEDATRHEGVPRFASRVAGVHVRRYGEGFLVQLGHHDALVRARGEHQPQATFVSCHLEVGLGVPQQVGQVVVQGVLDRQRLQSLSPEVVPANKNVKQEDGCWVSLNTRRLLTRS